MNLPAQYSYNPQPLLIFWNLGAGSAWIVVHILSWGQMPHGFNLWFGLLPIILGLLLGARRVTVARYLLLDRDQLILPTGFLQRHTTTIPYTSIDRVWRVHLPLTVVLRIVTEKGKFQVVSTLLPDSASYLEVEEFLNSRVQENVANQSRHTSDAD